MTAKNSPGGSSPASRSASCKPGWIELVDLGNGEIFGRRIPLRDLDKLRQTYPKVYRLLVWEFDDGVTPPGAIAVQHPASGERVWLVDEEVREWPGELERALKKAK